MSYEFRQLDESTVDAVGGVLGDRFCPEAARAVRRLLANPLRSPGDDVGVVVFRDGEAVGVTASSLRDVLKRPSWHPRHVSVSPGWT